MKRAGVVLLLASFSLPLFVSAQQSGTATSDPLTIIDKQAVDEWTKLTYGQQPPDPNTPPETPFLISLTPTERMGAFRFKQRCNACHGRQMSLAPNTWGPILTKKNVEGREDVVRKQIMEGSARMPAFKYALQPGDIEAIIQYMKKIETVPM